MRCPHQLIYKISHSVFEKEALNKWDILFSGYQHNVIKLSIGKYWRNKSFTN